MFTNLFKAKAEKVAKAQDSYNPPATTGFLADPTQLVSQLEEAPLISFNGQRTRSGFFSLDSEQVGNVLKIRDPKAPTPLTILNPRMAQHLQSSSGGKVSITGVSPQDYVLIDSIHPGGHLDLPIVVSTLRLGTVTTSPVQTISQQEEVVPLDPLSNTTLTDADGIVVKPSDIIVKKKASFNTSLSELLKESPSSNQYIETSPVNGVMKKKPTPSTGKQGNSLSTGTGSSPATIFGPIGK